MSEAMSDVLTNLREKAATLPSAKDASEAVRSHLPSVDVDAVRSHIPSRASKGRSKWAMGAMLVGGLAAAAAVFGFSRRRSAHAAATEASVYTPPLPKP